jgi:hypothetical protein
MQETVYFWLEPTFQMNVSPPSSGQVNCDENIVSRHSHRHSPVLKMEAIRSSETSVLTKNTRRKIPEDGFLH